MRVEAKQLTQWSVALDAARCTSGHSSNGKEPTQSFKRWMLKAEHSPIRSVMFEVTMYDIPYYVSVHLVRHKIGVEHFVQSQRDDRTDNDVPRSEIPQGALVTHKMIINAQALITMSRKRLCGMADPNTRYLWKLVKTAIRDIDAEVGDAMVTECVYRGFCPERNGCRYFECTKFCDERNKYMMP